MQAALIPILAAVGGSVAGAAAGAIFGPKPTKLPPAPVPLPTRTAAVSQALNADAIFRRRQGAAATMVTGANGAEAPSPGAKALLGQ